MIVPCGPKGWTGPEEVDGKKTEGSWRSHQVPMGDMDKPGHVAVLEQWLQGYRPEELFDRDGRLVPEPAELPPKGPRRMSANPHASGGTLLTDFVLPDCREHAVTVPAPRGRQRGIDAGRGPVRPHMAAQCQIHARVAHSLRQACSHPA